MRNGISPGRRWPSVRVQLLQTLPCRGTIYPCVRVRGGSWQGLFDLPAGPVLFPFELPVSPWRPKAQDVGQSCAGSDLALMQRPAVPPTGT